MQPKQDTADADFSYVTMEEGSGVQLTETGSGSNNGGATRPASGAVMTGKADPLVAATQAVYDSLIALLDSLLDLFTATIMVIAWAYLVFAMFKDGELECDWIFVEIYYFLACLLNIARFFFSCCTRGGVPIPYKGYSELTKSSLYLLLPFIFVELLCGLYATVWIPEDATCPETAPALFQGVSWLFKAELWYFGFLYGGQKFRN